MRETKLTLGRRVPDAERLAWAKTMAEKIGDRRPKGWPEVYALEQIVLAAEPQRELKLQAVRIGDVAIAAIPDEVFAITGLKLKLQSPLPNTFNIELANGAEGYIPPPEQHKLGGYTTWAARTAGLEVEAEPKIVEAVLKLLEEVAGQAAPRVARYRRHVRRGRACNRSRAVIGGSRKSAATRPPTQAATISTPITKTASRTICRARPAKACRRMANRAGPHTSRADACEPTVPDVGDTYSVEFWFWNGLPNDARAVTGYLFSRSAEQRWSRNRRSARYRGIIARCKRTAVFLNRQFAFSNVGKPYDD